MLQDTQEQVGWGLEQPSLAAGALVHGRGIGTKRRLRSLLNQTFQGFSNLGCCLHIPIAANLL